MRTAISTAIAVSALLLALPAQAINKCTQADGSVVFQDAPCRGKGEALVVKPASGYAAPRAAEPGPEAGAHGVAPSSSNVQAMEERMAASQREREARNIEQQSLPIAEHNIRQFLDRCKLEQDRLRQEQYAYVQNLYGKTHAAQKASEMAAAAARCDATERQMRDQVAQMVKQCKDLGGCKSR